MIILKNNIFELQLEIIINNNLLKKEIIDIKTYEEINLKLLKKLDDCKKGI